MYGDQNVLEKKLHISKQQF